MKTTKNDSTSQNTKSEEGCGRHFLQDHCDCGEPMTTHPTPTAEILKELKEWWDDDHTSGLFMEQHTLADFDRMYLLIEQRVLQALQHQHESDIQAFKEIIGEDEEVLYKTFSAMDYATGNMAHQVETDRRETRNDLRAELRKKLDALLK